MGGMGGLEGKGSREAIKEGLGVTIIFGPILQMHLLKSNLKCSCILDVYNYRISTTFMLNTIQFTFSLQLRLTTTCPPKLCNYNLRYNHSHTSRKPISSKIYCHSLLLYYTLPAADGQETPSPPPAPNTAAASEEN